MTYPIAVKSKDSAGGTQLAGGQSFFKVDSEPVILLGDAVAAHGLPPHASPVMATASGWMKINGIPVCRQGDIASCGHPSTGRGWFKIP